MNKKQKISLAVLGGVDATLYLATPMILATLWGLVNGFDWNAYVFYGIGIGSTLFRAIKIGWMK